MARAARAQALRFYQQAADAGVGAAQFLVGSMYEAGEGAARDVGLAVEYWRLAAAQGDLQSLNALAEALVAACDSGSTSDPRWREAREAFAAAAGGGHRDAQYNLAEVLLAESQLAQEGADTSEQLTQAAGWFGKAAEQGHAIARYNLAICYKHGQGVPQDEARSARAEPPRPPARSKARFRACARVFLCRGRGRGAPVADER